MATEVALVGLSSLLGLLTLSQSLSADESETAMVLKLVAANRVIDKVVESALFVLNVVERDDAVLEELIARVVAAFVAAAGQKRVEDKDGNAGDDEDWMLQKEDDQHCV